MSPAPLTVNVYPHHSSNLGQLAAHYAISAAQNTDSPAFAELTAGVCTKAVRLCLKNSGAINQAQYDLLDLMTTTSFYMFVRNSDPIVNDANTMRIVPQGSLLAFIDQGDRRLVHAMIATGHGTGAGTKNSCIGIGDDFGWQLLNLANDLTWAFPGVIQTSAKTGAPRLLTLRYRTLPLI